MYTFLEYLWVAFAVVLLFGASIFVHELGHFMVALWRRMRVEEFAIGFGPRIWSRVRNGIEYSVRWIPAGGFVRLPQMITSAALEGGDKPGDAPPPPAPPLSKILVAAAGPAMNVVFAFAVASLIYFTGLPVAVNPAIIGHVDPESEEYKLGIRDGDRVVEVAGKPIESWEDVYAIVMISRLATLPVVIESGGQRTTYELKAEINSIIDLKMLNLDPQDHPVVREVVKDSAAEAVGLKPGDVVISFAQVPIAGRDQFIKLIQQRPEKPTELVIERGDETLTLTITPRLNPGTQMGLIGAQIGSSAGVVYQVQKPGPTPWASFADVWDKTIGTIGALVYSKQTGVGARDLSGPVGIFAMLAAQVKTDYRLALSFLVLLNLNLAILNLLPIPVLDGGHIVMAIFEKIRGRPLHFKIVEYATTGFALLLISFMLYVTFFDIKRLPLIGLLFDRETRIEQTDKPPLAPSPSPAPAPSTP